MKPHVPILLAAAFIVLGITLSATPVAAQASCGATAGASGTNVLVTTSEPAYGPEPQNEPWSSVEPEYPDSVHVTHNGRNEVPERAYFRWFEVEMYDSIDGGGTFSLRLWTDMYYAPTTLRHAPRLCAPRLDIPLCPYSNDYWRFEYGGDTSNDFDSQRYHYVTFLQGFQQPTLYAGPPCGTSNPSFSCIRLPDNAIIATYAPPRTPPGPPGVWPGGTGVNNYAYAARPPQAIAARDPYQTETWKYLYRVDMPKMAVIRAPAFRNPEGMDRIAVAFHYIIPRFPVAPDTPTRADTTSVWATWSYRSGAQGQPRFPTWYGSSFWPNPIAPLNPPPPREPGASQFSTPGGFRVNDDPSVSGLAERHRYAAIAAAPNGTLYVAWTWIGSPEQGQNPLGIAPATTFIDRSLDGGSTWRNGANETFGPSLGASYTDVRVRDFRSFQRMRIRPDPPPPLPPNGLKFMDAPPVVSLAADPQDSDTVHLAWPEMEPGSQGNPSKTNIKYGKVKFLSDSNIEVFTKQVNDDQGTTDRYFPAIYVDSSRTIYLVWYDRRDDPLNQKFHGYYSRSDDLGATWSSNQRITLAPSDAEWAPGRPPGSENAFFGDYNRAISGNFAGAGDAGRQYHYAAFTANPFISSGDNTDIHFVPLHANGLSAWPTQITAGPITTVTFSLSAGVQNATRPYKLLGSAAGTAIGLNFNNGAFSCPPAPALAGVVLPLTSACVQDWLFCSTLNWTSACDSCSPCVSGTMTGFSGVLDGQGNATATLTDKFPLGDAQALPATYYFAFLLDNGSPAWNYASNVVTIVVQ